MYITTLVDDITKVLAAVEADHGHFTLAMLYSRSEEADSSWNLIVAAPWIDVAGKSETTRLIAYAMNMGLGLENKTAISRITALPMNDSFVNEALFYAARLNVPYPIPVRNITFGGVPVVSGLILRSVRN